MNDYTQGEISHAAKLLANNIREAREEAKVTPAHADVVYLADAANISNVGVTGNQVHDMLILQKIADGFNKMFDFFDRYGWLIAVVAGSIAMSVLVAYAFTNLIGSGA